jgi:hypothetical protein
MLRSIFRRKAKNNKIQDLIVISRRIYKKRKQDNYFKTQVKSYKGIKSKNNAHKRRKIKKIDKHQILL